MSQTPEPVPTHNDVPESPDSGTPQSNDNRDALSDLAAVTGAPSLPAGAPGTGAQLAAMSAVPAPEGSLLLSVVGACVGAAIGAAIWFAVEYLVNLQVGYVAIACGALAGWGAVGLGRRTGPEIGLIAALAGLVGVVGGSVANHHVQIRSDEVRAEIRAAFEAGLSSPESWVDLPAEQRQTMEQLARDWAEMTPEQKDEVHESFYQSVVAELGYVQWLKENPGDMVWMGLFGIIGMYAGYRIGAAKGSKA